MHGFCMLNCFLSRPDEVTFTAQFDRPGNIGRVHIGKAEIEGYKSKVGSVITSRDFITNSKGGPTWRLKFEICTFPLKGKVRFAFSDSTADARDFDDAIITQQETVRATPEGHENMPENLNNLAIVLLQRFKRTGNLSDIDAAISAFKQAIHLTDEDGLFMPLYLNNLGNAFLARYDRTGDTNDIMASISAYRESKCFDHTSNPFYIQTAIFCYSRPATDYDGYPDDRLVAAQYWVGLSQQHDPSQVLAAYSTAISLVSQVASLSQTIQARYRSLLKVSRLSTSAATVALGLERIDLALEWLERGRGLVWNQLNDLRTPIQVMKPSGADYPPANITEELERVSKALDRAGASRELWLAPSAGTSFTDVRALPGFEGFLKPLIHADMIDHLPASGHVVIINVHEDRCDALALRRGVHELCRISLPDFSYTKAEGLRESLKLYLHASGARTRGDWNATRGMRREGGSGGVVKNILRDLWILVVKPILNPGLCGESKSLTLPEFAISSYIPTFQTLVDRVKKPRKVEPENAGIFMISQPGTPNQSPIPKPERNAAATVNRVINIMENYTCVHFACHANQNTSDALKSGFALYDGQLDLSSIIQKQLVGAELAFLSACQTSTGDESLAEEAVHLAAGMLAAGYRSVVATMWSIQDQYGPKVAEGFYASLIDSESEGLNADGASRALHYAIQNLRKSLGDSESSLVSWVPYVHFGV
ncbi:CHAT domain-containing protein [Gymnopilus junonius]|uniref:CHAT domain-containing protein n=1 Tax=Gymnopilus junonius TaxID=109634 RepID=A0A9P5TEI8_GYMJU|nr:CHAT domain-containing protein [Gymnopilus junonius]